MTETLEGAFIRDRFNDCRSSLQESAALGVEHVIRGELADVWQECSVPNWDGYGAFSVTVESYWNALRFLRSLPLGIPAPSIGAEPDGQITLEWGSSRRRRLSISVDENGDLHYAALLGSGRTCGTEPFFEEAPDRLLDLIRETSRC